jgi:hypothetical protein
MENCFREVKLIKITLELAKWMESFRRDLLEVSGFDEHLSRIS